MHSIFVQYLFLILIILALNLIADKLRLAYPIVLVVGGLALSFTTQFSGISIHPELVFFIFLPPLLYEAANIVERVLEMATIDREFCFSDRDNHRMRYRLR
ncbi:MAG TPA: hypothetical protein VFP47_10405, partial [Pyrinomonadaceae bacterium]|nr:hypothetical protein [Pyrinomonadaceae bacterium]